MFLWERHGDVAVAFRQITEYQAFCKGRIEYS